MSSRARGEWADLAATFRGVTVTTVTPFLPQTLDLDLRGFDANLRVLRESGLSVIVPAGNTGEFSSLTTDEIALLADHAVAEIGASAAVVVGVGGDVRSATALAMRAAQAGAHGIMIHEPAHPFLSDDGLVAYYDAICRSVDIGVAIYKRSPRIPDRVLLDVARTLPNVVAIKYAHNDVAAFLALAAAAPDRVTCACGSAERWALPFSAAGRAGYTSGIANFAPGLTLRFWHALGSDRAAARSLWQEIVPLEDIRAAESAAFNVSVIKYAMEQMGLAAGPVRPPLSPLHAATASAVTSIIEGWEVSGNFARPAPVPVGDARAVATQSHLMSRETEVEMA
jgi:4-hydroxy-tetrahydrodipicolinate synthase